MEHCWDYLLPLLVAYRLAGQPPVEILARAEGSKTGVSWKDSVKIKTLPFDVAASMQLSGYDGAEVYSLSVKICGT